MELKPIAYYLPQYHPIPENNEWWGTGFTEWTNVAKAMPLFKNHLQPRYPADLGYYDLRVPEVREAQANMARENGVYGFCYYHYWFGNRRQLLERPFNDVLNSGRPDFPFMLCWANQTWSGHWFGAHKRVLMEQRYPGKKDIEEHFEFLLKAFTDPRYIFIDDKPVFKILEIKEQEIMREIAYELKQMAVKKGLKGLYLIAGNLHPPGWRPEDNYFDALTDPTFSRTLSKTIKSKESILDKIYYNRFTAEKVDSLYYRRSRILTMKEFVNNYEIPVTSFENIPIVIPNWDNTPRAGKKGIVILNSEPFYFEKQLRISSAYIKENNHTGMLFIKSWNEWAEGNYLEPDTIYGLQYLDVLKNFMNECR